MTGLDEMVSALTRAGIEYEREEADVDNTLGTELRVGATAFHFDCDGVMVGTEDLYPLSVPQYVEGAISTEQIDFDGIRERMTQNNVVMLLKALRAFSKISGHIEQLKKVLIYGKDPDGYLEPLDMSVFDPITTGQVENTVTAVQDDQVLRLLHGVLGTASEAGELATAVLAHLREAFGIDWVNLTEEVGDNQWYIAIITDVIQRMHGEAQHGQHGIGEGLLHALNVNRKKLLKIRYKGGFSEEAALNRDTDAERAALEGNDDADSD